MPTGFLDVALDLCCRVYQYVLIANFPLAAYIQYIYRYPRAPCFLRQTKGPSTAIKAGQRRSARSALRRQYVPGQAAAWNG